MRGFLYPLPWLRLEIGVNEIVLLWFLLNRETSLLGGATMAD